MRRNNQSNRLIKYIVVLGDFVLLNIVMLFMVLWNEDCGIGRSEEFALANNFALAVAMTQFSTIIHLRLVNASDMLRRAIALVLMQTLVFYILLKLMGFSMPVGLTITKVNGVFAFFLIIKRVAERSLIKLYRRFGGNTRAVTLVGSDVELLTIYGKLLDDATLGYNVLGYYGDPELAKKSKERQPDGTYFRKPLRWLGYMDFFMTQMDNPKLLTLGDDLYLCISRLEADTIKRVSYFCDKQVMRFYYVQISMETIGLNLKREMLDDVEVFVTLDIPIRNSVNRVLKRVLDIVVSLAALVLIGMLLPLIWYKVRKESPGPLFFRQRRTGMDGKDFYCYKFRSMHVNNDADRLQATENDPRKFKFGDTMRRLNIDELPQFLNVLMGDMSVVGPRPHMLAHTNQYSAIISKYMVRHFVKPGVTGWAQISGFRGETKELWQMEERVKHDIWYIENWSLMLDIQIISISAAASAKVSPNTFVKNKGKAMDNNETACSQI